MATTWTCDICGTALKPVFPELNRRYDDCQFENCLHVVLGGGYGEFVDGSIKLDLCKSCAENFLLQNERIADKLDEVEPDFGCAPDCDCHK